MIRKYRIADRVQIFSLIGMVFGDEIAAKMETGFDWQFEHNPYAPADGPNIWVVVDKTEIVGMLASFPVPMKVYDRECMVFCLINFLSHPRHRGAGAGLAKRMVSTTEFTLGVPTKESYPLWKELGCFDFCNVVQVIHLVNARSVLKKNGFPKIATALLGAAWDCVRKLVFDRARAGASAFSFIEITRFDESIDRLWKEVSAGYPIITIRSSRYLNWRFFDCPDKRYRVYLAQKDASVSGYIVFRTGTTRGLNRGYLVDFLVAHGDTTTLNGLVLNAVKALREEGVDTISCLTAMGDATSRAVLRRRGFLFDKRQTKVTGSAYPHLLPGCERTTEAAWFRTLGDGDADFY